MRKTMWVALATAMAVLGGCETATPVKVTRFHLNAPLDRGGVIVAANPALSNIAALEADLYAAAIRDAMAAQGFAPSSDAAAPLYASFTVGRTIREVEPARSPVTIGIGGGSFGGGVGGGVGGGASVAFGVGKKRAREAYVTELSVQIRRGAAGEIVWEGRALTEADTRSPDAQPPATARKLAQALFKGFPGESGRTISVK
ncbi:MULTISPECIES: DUF4136 domain-containing protein [Sphingomonas]|uniref:DUF4136 domain-containing protein n=1 Tax=Sphingomonas TaxID=13687 RepID=UPI00083000A0|nr:DUF4136 domain-containing protein [Sphingomonas sp. CCH10-B3]